MKKIILLLTFLGTLYSCGVPRHLSKSEYDKFSSKGDSIFYNGICVAKYSHLEWEYYRGHKTLEISIEKMNSGVDDMADNIVNYVRTKNRNLKIELIIPNYPLTKQN
jgi:hypothetical protein